MSLTLTVGKNAAPNPGPNSLTISCALEHDGQALVECLKSKASPYFDTSILMQDQKSLEEMVAAVPIIAKKYGLTREQLFFGAQAFELLGIHSIQKVGNSGINPQQFLSEETLNQVTKRIKEVHGTALMNRYHSMSDRLEWVAAALTLTPDSRVSKARPLQKELTKAIWNLVPEDKISPRRKDLWEMGLGAMVEFVKTNRAGTIQELYNPEKVPLAEMNYWKKGTGNFIWNSGPRSLEKVPPASTCPKQTNGTLYPRNGSGSEVYFSDSLRIMGMQPCGDSAYFFVTSGTRSEGWIPAAELMRKTVALTPEQPCKVSESFSKCLRDAGLDPYIVRKSGSPVTSSVVVSAKEAFRKIYPSDWALFKAIKSTYKPDPVLPKILPYLTGYREISSAEKQELVTGIRAYRQRTANKDDPWGFSENGMKTYFGDRLRKIETCLKGKECWGHVTYLKTWLKSLPQTPKELESFRALYQDELTHTYTSQADWNGHQAELREAAAMDSNPMLQTQLIEPMDRCLNTTLLDYPVARAWLSRRLGAWASVEPEFSPFYNMMGNQYQEERRGTGPDLNNYSISFLASQAIQSKATTTRALNTWEMILDLCKSIQGKSPAQDTALSQCTPDSAPLEKAPAVQGIQGAAQTVAAKLLNQESPEDTRLATQFAAKFPLPRNPNDFSRAINTVDWRPLLNDDQLVRKIMDSRCTPTLEISKAKSALRIKGYEAVGSIEVSRDDTLQLDEYVLTPLPVCSLPAKEAK